MRGNPASLWPAPPLMRGNSPLRAKRSKPLCFRRPRPAPAFSWLNSKMPKAATRASFARGWRVLPVLRAIPLGSRKIPSPTTGSRCPPLASSVPIAGRSHRRLRMRLSVHALMPTGSRPPRRWKSPRPSQQPHQPRLPWWTFPPPRPQQNNRLWRLHHPRLKLRDRSRMWFNPSFPTIPARIPMRQSPPSASASSGSGGQSLQAPCWQPFGFLVVRASRNEHHRSRHLPRECIGGHEWTLATRCACS